MQFNIKIDRIIGFRMILLGIGSALMGVGVALAAASTFGADSVALLWEGMHLSMGISLGTANLVFSFLFLIAVVLVDRRQIGIGTIVSPIIQGIVIDICGLFFHEFIGITWQLIACVIGIVIIAIGSGIYASADIGKGPYIGITFAVEKKYSLNLTKFRILLDIVCLCLGILLGAKLSIGPVLSILLMGIITEYSCVYSERYIVKPYMIKASNKIIYD